MQVRSTKGMLQQEMGLCTDACQEGKHTVTSSRAGMIYSCHLCATYCAAKNAHICQS